MAHILPIAVPIGERIVEGNHMMRGQNQSILLVKQSLIVECSAISYSCCVLHSVEFKAKHRFQPTLVVVCRFPTPRLKEVLVIGEPSTIANLRRRTEVVIISCNLYAASHLRLPTTPIPKWRNAQNAFAEAINGIDGASHIFAMKDDRTRSFVHIDAMAFEIIQFERVINKRSTVWCIIINDNYSQAFLCLTTFNNIGSKAHHLSEIFLKSLNSQHDLTFLAG